MHTSDQIKAAIANLHTLSDDDLIHSWKCAHSTGSKLYKPYLDAIDRERRKRGKVSSTTDVSTESNLEE